MRLNVVTLDAATTLAAINSQQVDCCSKKVEVIVFSYYLSHAVLKKRIISRT
jgi:hypothetical protein